MSAVRHIFLWRVAEGNTQERIVEILNTLPGKVPAIKEWQLGTHEGDPGENGAPWDGALITDFDSWEGLEEYSSDPYHVAVVERLLPMFADRAVVDYQIGQ